MLRDVRCDAVDLPGRGETDVISLCAKSQSRSSHIGWSLEKCKAKNVRRSVRQKFNGFSIGCGWCKNAGWT